MRLTKEYKQSLINMLNSQNSEDVNFGKAIIETHHRRYLIDKFFKYSKGELSIDSLDYKLITSYIDMIHGINSPYDTSINVGDFRDCINDDYDYSIWTRADSGGTVQYNNWGNDGTSVYRY